MSLISKQTLKIYVDHGEAYGNLGDEAMLIAAVEKLKKEFGSCEFIIPCDRNKPLPAGLKNFRIIASPFGVLSKWLKWTKIFTVAIRLLALLPVVSKYVPRNREIVAWWLVTSAATCGVKIPFLHNVLGREFNEFIDALSDCDVFYGVGAADFNDFWLPGVIYKSWLYRVARQYVKVAVLSAQGIGPLNTQWARRIAAKSFPKLDLLTFRDNFYSKELVDSLMADKVKNKIVGDEAFGLEPSSEDDARELLKDVGLASSAPFIAVHFRSTDYTRDTKFLASRIAGVLDLISRTVTYDLVFIPMSYHEHSGQDEEYGRFIRSMMVHKERLHICPTNRDVKKNKAVVGLARYSLGLSYHVHVFSLSQSHPAIILYTGDYYKFKSDGLIGFYGEPCSSLNLLDRSDEQVIEIVRKVEDQYDDACKNIARINNEISQQSGWVLSEMKQLLQYAGKSENEYNKTVCKQNI